MTDNTLRGPWVRRVLLEHLRGERQLARHTPRSDRAARVLLMPCIADPGRQPGEPLLIDAVTAAHVRLFLPALAQGRRGRVTTRHQRRAVLHALARFIGPPSPESSAWCGPLRAMPCKKAAQPQSTSLENAAMEALLAAPDRNPAQGRRA